MSPPTVCASVCHCNYVIAVSLIHFVCRRRDIVTVVVVVIVIVILIVIVSENRSPLSAETQAVKETGTLSAKEKAI